MESSRAASPSGASASPFVEGLVYSQQETKRRNVYGSLARLSQELGAELCGRLSQVVLQQLPTFAETLPSSLTGVPTASKAAAPQTTTLTTANENEVPLPMLTDVQRDLSAHYGSHALRRGLAKPFGPCVHPVLRKGKLTISRAGVHGPRYMRLWCLHRAHQCWCPRCGVWLTRGAGNSSGTNSNKAGDEHRTHLLATVAECRVRQRRGRRRAARKSSPSGKFTVCCVRCLHREHKAAARAAGQQPLPFSPAVKPTNANPVQSTRASSEEKTKRGAPRSAARGEVTKKTLTGVVAAARVAKRNRRRHRRSARRPPKVSGDSASAKRKLLTTTTSAHVQHALATALKKQTRVAKTAATPSTTSKASAKPPSAPTSPTSKLPPVPAAQKMLQGLVPSGPLKKMKGTTRPLEKAPLESTTASVNANAGHDVSAAKATASSSLSSSPHTQHSSLTVEYKEEARSMSTAAPSRPASVTPATMASKERSSASPSKASHTGSLTVNQSQKKALSSLSAEEKETVRTTTKTTPLPSSGEKLLTAPVKMNKPASALSPPLTVPKGPPVKTLPKKPLKPPVKTPAKATGKSKLMDAMNQLGF